MYGGGLPTSSFSHHPKPPQTFTYGQKDGGRRNKEDGEEGRKNANGGEMEKVVEEGTGRGGSGWDGRK